MTSTERHVCIAGVALFLFGLLLGFVVPIFPDKQSVLNAHLTALGSGTFLIAIGFLWRRLNLSTKTSTIFAHILWISFYVLEAGLTLDAASAAGQGHEQSTVGHSVAGLLNAIGAIPMTIAVVVVLVGLVKARNVPSS